MSAWVCQTGIVVFWEIFGKEGGPTLVEPQAKVTRKTFAKKNLESAKDLAPCKDEAIASFQL